MNVYRSMASMAIAFRVIISSPDNFKDALKDGEQEQTAQLRQSQNLRMRERISNAMRLLIPFTLLAAIACTQNPAETSEKAVPQKPGPTLSVGFSETTTPPGLVDTDLFDQQKYVEQSGGDSSSIKAKRESHEAALTREFFDGFNNEKDCDRIVFKGKGDQKPQFTLQIMVDTHDTPGQKTEWVWVLTRTAANKFIAKAHEDSSSQAAKNICLAVRKAGEPRTSTTARTE